MCRHGTWPRHGLFFQPSRVVGQPGVSPVWPPWDHADLRLDGDQYKVELLAGRSSGNTTTPVTSIGFLSGTNAAYFDGGVVTVNGIPGGVTAYLTIRFWNSSYGSNYDPGAKTRSAAPDRQRGGVYCPSAAAQGASSVEKEIPFKLTGPLGGVKRSSAVVPAKLEISAAHFT
jgi:hypothetical protein